MAATLIPTAQQLFGSDLALVDGDLAAVPRNGLVDFSIISGIPNLQQAVLDRLRTVPGDLVMHPDYGANINGLLSMPMAQAQALVTKYVTQALVNESRIQNVVNVALTQTALNAFNMVVTVQLVTQTSPVDIIFPNFLT